MNYPRVRSGSEDPAGNRLARDLSAAVLAGGRSRRMGRDKAFLTFRGKPFISLITMKLSTITDDVLVVTGARGAARLEGVLGNEARIIEDTHHLNNPMGGMLSACEAIRREYVAFLACDLPLVKSSVVLSLYLSARGRSAAIPRWDNGDMEPLCAVYNVKDASRAGLVALKNGKIGCRNLISHLKNPSFIPVDSLRSLDPELASLKNVNSPEDLASLSTSWTP